MVHTASIGDKCKSVAGISIEGCMECYIGVGLAGSDQLRELVRLVSRFEWLYESD